MPLASARRLDALPLIQNCVRRCEGEGVDVLLCPEAILGGLADDLERPIQIAITVGNGELRALLAPLSSKSVTTILGFTEADAGKLYNSAAVFSRGEVLGVYRKRHPARRSSVYAPGEKSAVFTVGSHRFGIMICNDTNFPDVAAGLAAHGASLALVPSNNALRPEYADVVAVTRETDVANARRSGLAVVRADVAGDLGTRRSLGSSSIIDRGGEILRAGRIGVEDLLVADLGAN
jgi:predicted amidohydrolase